MPPSFKGADGKIVYSLEARLSRSMRIDQTDLTKITFIPNVDWSQASELMVRLWCVHSAHIDCLNVFWNFTCIKLNFLGFFQEPQHESKDKKMKLFNSGCVSMDVSLEKTGFCQGGGFQPRSCTSRPTITLDWRTNGLNVFTQERG